jgi:hypothetical protein
LSTCCPRVPLVLGNRQRLGSRRQQLLFPIWTQLRTIPDTNEWETLPAQELGHDGGSSRDRGCIRCSPGEHTTWTRPWRSSRSTVSLNPQSWGPTALATKAVQTLGRRGSRSSMTFQGEQNHSRGSDTNVARTPWAWVRLSSDCGDFDPSN